MKTVIHNITKTGPSSKKRFFSAVKIENFIRNVFDIFDILAQNIDCVNTLEAPRRGGSNKYPQSMFWIKNKKIRYTPAYPSFAIKKWGLRGYTFHGHVFLMIKLYRCVHLLMYPRDIQK